MVELASFYERGFGLPLHSFVWGILHYYKLELQNFHPNSILHIACFITLCEAFMGIWPHWQLWKHFFSPRLTTGRGGQQFVDCFSIQLCPSKQV